MRTAIAFTFALFSVPLMADWEQIKTVKPGTTIDVLLRDGKSAQGKLRSWSPNTIELENTRVLVMEDVRRVRVKQKTSRWKGAMWGAIAGFAIAFPIGAANAGFIADRNSPGFGTRVAVGSGLGIYGAGIGAPIGALVSGSKRVTLYEAKDTR